MKKLVLSLTLVMVSTLVMAQDFTQQEINILKQVVANAPRLKALADNLSSETLPLELSKLRQEREELITQRNAEVGVVKQQAIGDVSSIMMSYETLIDAKEGEISAKQNEIKNLK